MKLIDILEYYSRDDVQQAILKTAENREVVGVFQNGEYGSRPNVLLYPADIKAMIKSGVVELHCSIERWSDAMMLSKQNYNHLRTGWDLILDIDCKNFKHGKIGALSVLKALKKHEIKNVSVKFTGNMGWHIGIAWESFPKEVNFKKTSLLYPELARKICSYLKEYTKSDLEKNFLRVSSPENLAEESGKKLSEIMTEDGIDPWKIIELDPVLISPRHLFRMPYSLHRKTFLVSMPVKPSDVEDFKPELAKPEKVKADLNFLDKFAENECEILIAEALDWHVNRHEQEKKKKSKILIKKAIGKEFFPPCIKTILEGLPDGRKRSIFILLNFLRNMKWEWQEIENFIEEWNQRNKPPLRDSYVRAQIRYAKKLKKIIPPPNCSNEAYYKSFGVCKPDRYCEDLKNPATYPFRILNLRRKR